MKIKFKYAVIMNLFLINLLTVLFRLTSISCIGSSTFNILSKVPFGQYELIFKQIRRCDISKNYKIQFNLYLVHNPESNATEIRGTTISSIPVDDSLFLEANFALRDVDGKWKENTYIHKSPNACSSLRLLMGAGWTTVMNGLGVQNATCPILPGNYTATGLDTSIFLNTNIPKAFIYGTYRIRYFYSRSNEVYGCTIFVLEFKRL